MCFSHSPSSSRLVVHHSLPRPIGHLDSPISPCFCLTVCCLGRPVLLDNHSSRPSCSAFQSTNHTRWPQLPRNPALRRHLNHSPSPLTNTRPGICDQLDRVAQRFTIARLPEIHLDGLQSSDQAGMSPDPDQTPACTAMPSFTASTVSMLTTDFVVVAHA